MSDEPMQPLKFQSSSEGSSFLIYSQSSAIYIIVEKDRQPEFFDKIVAATGITGPLEKKYFMGTVNADGKLVIDAERGNLLPQPW